MGEKIVRIDDFENHHLFTVKDSNGDKKEAILVGHDSGIECWLNYCRHLTTVKLHDGENISRRDEEIICNNHGAIFDVKDGECTHGPCKGSNLIQVKVEIDEEVVELVDDEYRYLSDGSIDDEGGYLPDSTTGESDF